MAPKLMRYVQSLSAHYGLLTCLAAPQCCSQPCKGAMAGITIAGVFVSILAAIIAVLTNCKQISDTLVDARSYLKFNDHGAKIGYQHAVSVCAFRPAELQGNFKVHNQAKRVPYPGAASSSDQVCLLLQLIPTVAA